MTISIAEIEQSVQKEQLVLSHKKLTDSDIELICLFLNNHSNITSIDLSFNLISDEGAKRLAKIKNLSSIDLRSNKIGDEGVIALAVNPSIKSLSMGFNSIGNDGAKALAASTTLTDLSLFKNQIGDAGAKAFFENTSLRMLDISYNPISAQCHAELAARRVLLSKDMYGRKIVLESKQNIEHKISPTPTSTINMTILGGFIAATGICAIALAFTVLNAATLGLSGLIVAGIGIAATIAGVGFFAYDKYKNSAVIENKPVIDSHLAAI